MISSKNLAQALYKLSEGGLASDKIVSATLAYLEKYRLLAILPATIHHLEHFQRSDQDFQKLEIVSGLAIDNEIVTGIKRQLGADPHTKTTEKIDKEIIGGFIATHKGFIYDASLRHQINLLRAKLIEN